MSSPFGQIGIDQNWDEKRNDDVGKGGDIYELASIKK